MGRNIYPMRTSSRKPPTSKCIAKSSPKRRRRGDAPSRPHVEMTVVERATIALAMDDVHRMLASMREKTPLLYARVNLNTVTCACARLMATVAEASGARAFHGPGEPEGRDVVKDALRCIAQRTGKLYNVLYRQRRLSGFGKHTDMCDAVAGIITNLVGDVVRDGVEVPLPHERIDRFLRVKNAKCK